MTIKDTVARTIARKADAKVGEIIGQTTTKVAEEITTPIPSNWAIGGLTSAGMETSVTNSYRSGYIDVSKVKRLRLENSTIMYRVNLYNAAKQMLRQAAFDINYYTVDDDVYFVRIVVADTSKTSYQVYAVDVTTTTEPIFIPSALKFGFMPSNDAATNAVALQRAVDAGGMIRVEQPGIYDIDRAIKIGDNVTLNFGPGVFLRRTTSNGYVLVNKGAFTRSYNKNIVIRGLKLICNGKESTAGSDLITGLRGQISFFYVKNLSIENFECLDLLSYSYCVQICTFEDVIIDKIRVEGGKDAVHFGRGSNFVVRDGKFKTYDDPIALNGHDYDTGNPQLGWIENGLIENCYDLTAASTTGYFLRVLAGAWVDWFSGMELQKSDTVVSNGRLYRVVANPDGTKYTSMTAPTHVNGTVTLDGNIKWVMIQDDVTYTAGCRNVHLKNIYLQKNRPVAVSLHLDKDNYSRSYYPNATPPIQKNIILENIHMQTDIPRLITATTPVDTIKLVNSEITNTSIVLNNISTAGMTYSNTNLIMMGVTFKGTGGQRLVNCAGGRTASVKVVGSVVENATYAPTFSSGVTIVAKDI
ncbi:hypothetical protein D1872_197720 [compost metagenome]